MWTLNKIKSYKDDDGSADVAFIFVARHFEALLKKLILIQRTVRKYLTQKEAKRAAIVTLQRIWRGALGRKKAARAAEEKRAEAADKSPEAHLLNWVIDLTGDEEERMGAAKKRKRSREVEPRPKKRTRKMDRLRLNRYVGTNYIVRFNNTNVWGRGKITKATADGKVQYKLQGDEASVERCTSAAAFTSLTTNPKNFLWVEETDHFEGSSIRDYCRCDRCGAGMLRWRCEQVWVCDRVECGRAVGCPSL